MKSRFSLQSKLLVMVALPVLATLGLWASSRLSQARTNEQYDTAMRWSEHALAAKKESLLTFKYMSAAGRAVRDGDPASLAETHALRAELLAASQHSTALAAAFGEEEVEEESALHAQILELIGAVSKALILAQREGGAAGSAHYEAEAVAIRDRLVQKLEDRVGAESEGSRVWHQQADAAADAQARLGLWVALASVLILLPSIAFARQLRRGVSALQHGALRVARQDFSTPVRVDSRDELAELAKIFNQMSASVEAHHENEVAMAVAAARVRALEEARAGLESQVADRTAALAQANADLHESLAAVTESNARLQMSERLAAIGTLAAGVAHEINNPVGYVASNLNFVIGEFARLDRPTTPRAAQQVEEMRQALEDAMEGARRIATIVKAMKTLARSDANEAAEVLDLHEALDSAANIAGSAFKTQSRLEREFGPCPQVKASASKLGQVFLNLIVNAAQAMPPGREGNLTTLVTRTGARGEAIVEVIDNGVGIPDAIKGKVFDAFFTTKPPGVGTGLGLAICHSIVTGLNGSIEVESECGRGTTFRVCLPAASQPAEAPERVPTQLSPGKAQLQLAPRTLALAGAGRP